MDVQDAQDKTPERIPWSEHSLDKNEEARLALEAMINEAQGAWPEDINPEVPGIVSSLLVDALTSRDPNAYDDFAVKICSLADQYAPEYTKRRDQACIMAPRDPQGALALARTIEHPWFRCQAISCAAEHTQDVQVRNDLMQESFMAALGLEEPNRIVSVSSWPLSVLCKHEQWSDVETETGRLLAIIDMEPSPVRRMHALEYLCQTLRTAPHNVKLPVFKSFVAACLTPLSGGRRNQRGEAHLARMLSTIHAHVDQAWASELTDRITGPTLHAQAVASIQRLQENTEVE